MHSSFLRWWCVNNVLPVPRGTSFHVDCLSQAQWFFFACHCYWVTFGAFCCHCLDVDSFASANPAVLWAQHLTSMFPRRAPDGAFTYHCVGHDVDHALVSSCLGLLVLIPCIGLFVSVSPCSACFRKVSLASLDFCARPNVGAGSLCKHLLTCNCTLHRCPTFESHVLRTSVSR